jgi:3-isopropylmalate dehydrogenase
MSHAREIYRIFRHEFDLYALIRPLYLFDPAHSLLKNCNPGDIHAHIIAENREGLYQNLGGVHQRNTPHVVAFQQEIHTRRNVQRVLRFAFDFARKLGRARLTLIVRAAILRYGHDLWVRVLRELSEEYGDISATHQEIPVFILKFLQNPELFQVIVSNSAMGEIISYIGIALHGGLGMSAQVWKGDIPPFLYEPVLGGQYHLAGQNQVNPIGAFQALSMFLEDRGFKAASTILHKAIQESIEKGWMTPDIQGSVGTTEVGDFICSAIHRLTHL